MEIALILIYLIPIPILITYILYNTNKGTEALGNLGTPKSQNCPRIQKLMLI